MPWFLFENFVDTASAGERDAKFPIVVNDNRSCVRCDVADSLIRVRIAGPRDKTVHTHEFPLKPQFQP